MSDPMELLRQHCENFNQGVLSGDFSAMIAGFAADAEMIFVGIPVGPFTGRAEIARAYAEQPPDDTLTLLRCSADGTTAHADYAWSKDPDELAGQLDLEFDNAEIRRLTVNYLK